MCTSSIIWSCSIISRVFKLKHILQFNLYRETCISRTPNKPNSCTNKTLYKFLMQKI